MATLEELEARLATLETTVSKIKSCTCDPSNYASAEDMRQAQRTIDALETALVNVSNKIGTLPDGKTVVSYVDEKTANAGGGGVSTEEFNGLVTRVDGLDDSLAQIGTIPAGKTLVGYVDEQTSITTQQMQTEPMFEFTVPAGSASITVETPSDFWNAVGRGLMVAVNGGQALETTWHIGGDTKNVRSDYVYIDMVGTWSIDVTAYASDSKDISIDRHVVFYGMTDVVESVKTKVATLENKIDNLPEGGGITREEVEGIIAESDVGLSEEEVNTLLEPIKSDINGIKLDTNNIKNAPKYKLMWTASELQAVLGGILSSADTTNFALADGSTLVTSDGNDFNTKEN